jgi:hypothetical protein
MISCFIGWKSAQDTEKKAKAGPRGKRRATRSFRSQNIAGATGICCTFVAGFITVITGIYEN